MKRFNISYMKGDFMREKFSGIYTIITPINGYSYVGRAVDFYARKGVEYFEFSQVNEEEADNFLDRIDKRELEFSFWVK